MSPVPSPASNPPSEAGRISAADGVALAWYRWDPAGKARGTVCLAHGHGEHAGRYHHVARAFTEAGFVFLAFDLLAHARPGAPSRAYGPNGGRPFLLRRAATRPRRHRRGHRHQPLAATGLSGAGAQ